METFSNFEDWADYFIDVGLPEKIRFKYLVYLQPIIENDCPVVFEFDHLAALLGRSTYYLASTINHSEKHYRQFLIPKRKGGSREINAPYPALLECQQWILRNILSKVKVHPKAMAFRPKGSILKNATPHLGKKCILKMDFKEFFPSIGLARIIKVFRNIGYFPNVSFYLASLCCLNGALPQGAPTSPYLSNIVTKLLDSRLNNLAKKTKLSYTRYADDITFSGKHIGLGFIKYIENIIQESGFQVNKEKTILSRNSGKKIVTGISVGGNTPKLPRAYKRKLRQEIHYIFKYGYISHISKKKIREPFYLSSIYGKLLFWKWIEPENKFVNNYIPHLKELIFFRNGAD